MVDVNSTFESIFGTLGSVTQSIRGIIESVAGEYTILATLAIAAVGGYYISRRYPIGSVTTNIIAYALIIFLILQFV